MGSPAPGRLHPVHPVPTRALWGGWGGLHCLPSPPQAEEMISEIRAAFEVSLDQLDWMDEKTRQAAKEKVTPGREVSGKPHPIHMSPHLTAGASPHAGRCHLRHDWLP